MRDTFAIYALRRKRTRLAGEIVSGQQAVARKREALATLDAVIRMFEPHSNPELIAPVRPHSRRYLFFRRGEQTRICLAALREAGKPVTVRWVAEYAIAAKGLETDARVREKIVGSVRQTLERIGARGLARKIVEWPDTWWELVG